MPKKSHLEIFFYILICKIHFRRLELESGEPMRHSDRWGTCECHLQATLSSWSRIYEVSSSGRVFRIAIAHPVVHAWSPCVHWEGCDNCQLFWLGSQMRTEASFWKKKYQKGRTSFTKFLHNQKSFLSSFFSFHFYCLYYFGGKWNKWSLLISQTCNQRDMRRWSYWWSEVLCKGTNVWLLCKFRGKMVESWDLTDQPAWQNQWPPGSEEAFLKLKNKVQSREARHPKSN